MLAPPCGNREHSFRWWFWSVLPWSSSAFQFVQPTGLNQLEPGDSWCSPSGLRLRTRPRFYLAAIALGVAHWGCSYSLKLFWGGPHWCCRGTSSPGGSPASIWKQRALLSAGASLLFWCRSRPSSLIPYSDSEECRLISTDAQEWKHRPRSGAEATCPMKIVWMTILFIR